MSPILARTVGVSTALGLLIGAGALSRATYLSKSDASSELRVSSAPTCDVTIDSRFAVKFGDRRFAYVNVEDGSSSASRRDVAVVGVPTYRWIVNGDGTIDPASVSSELIGAVVGLRGEARPIANPLPGKRIWHPRIARAERGGWHVVLMELLGGTDSSKALFDSTALWYGRFDSTGWHDLQRIGRFENANFGTTSNFDLVADGSSVAIAFGYDRGRLIASNARGNQGVIVIHNRLRRWTSDTLFTELGPNAVRLARGAESPSLGVALVRAFFDKRPMVQVSSVFFAPYDSTWGVSRHIGGDGVRPTTRLSLVPQKDRFVAIWVHSDSAGQPQVEWTTIGDEPSGARQLFGPAQDFSATTLSDQRVFVIARTVREPNKQHAAIIDAKGAHPAGTISIPIDGQHLKAIALARDSVAIFAAELGKRDVDPPATTFLTLVRARCATQR